MSYSLKPYKSYWTDLVLLQSFYSAPKQHYKSLRYCNLRTQQRTKGNQSSFYPLSNCTRIHNPKIIRVKGWRVEITAPINIFFFSFFGFKLKKQFKYFYWALQTFCLEKKLWGFIMVIELSGVQFGLKSYLRFQIELALRARSILKPRVWFQTKLHSTQFNYHY